MTPKEVKRICSLVNPSRFIRSACRQYLQAIPLTPPPDPEPRFLFWEIFGDGDHRFKSIIRYCKLFHISPGPSGSQLIDSSTRASSDADERATDRHHETWNSSSFSNPTALMFSISRTGGSLVKPALLLKRYMEVVSLLWLTLRSISVRSPITDEISCLVGKNFETGTRRSEPPCDLCFTQ